MDDLRWALLAVAVALLVAIFVWTRFGGRWRQRAASRMELRTEPSVVLAAPAAAPVRVRPVALPEKIVTLRLMSRDPAGFPGGDLVGALAGAGLAHGRYGIFHSADPGQPDNAAFSVASLVEPGSFDLERVGGMRFPGVSLFLGIPGPSDPVQAFDAMVAAGRALCDRLGGELLDEQGSTLSIQRQRYIREEIIHFQHRQAARPA